jgi:phosphatidate phosphatase PAH1
MIVDEEAVVLDSAIIAETKDYEEPFWLNKELKQVMVIIIYPDGKRLPASVSGEGGNPDYIAIMEKFTEEEIDENTRLREERRTEEVRQRMERSKVDQQRRKDETLFEAKLEAFEVAIIKNSTNKALKTKIRRSKSALEVMAYATMLIMEEEKNAE